MDEEAVGSAPRPGRVLQRIFQSTLVLKYIMALTGLALVGFLVAHLAGNLLIFKGPEALNEYALGLRKLGAILWLLRIGLIVAVLLHIWSAFKLTMINRRARPVKYAFNATVKATYAARTMRYSGVIVLAYVLYHLAHFTWGIVDPAGYSLVTKDGLHDVYNMAVRGFSNPTVAILYVVAQLLTGWHMSHGFSSAFQSLGLLNRTYRPVVRMLGPILGWGLALGFCSIPIAVLTGLVQMAA
jgi:succinate dehydrogenase / fumarate reductase cytochrome b subunit